MVEVMEGQERPVSHRQPVERPLENVEVGRHAVVRRAIVDKNVVIPPGTKIGVDPEADRKRFQMTESGIVVIPKGMKVT